MVNQQLEGHRTTCIMLSLDTYVINTISLDNYSRMELSLLTVKSNNNIADPLTKGLNKKLVKKSSRGKGLKHIE